MWYKILVVDDTNFFRVGDSQVQFGYLNYFFVCLGQDIYWIQAILENHYNAQEWKVSTFINWCWSDPGTHDYAMLDWLYFVFF